jgi:hypothetical protein
LAGDQGNFIEYKNVPMTIGLALSAKMATLNELQTVYGLEDVYDMLEIASVDAHNQNLARKA